jgi:hypothetical protein
MEKIKTLCLHSILCIHCRLVFVILIVSINEINLSDRAHGTVRPVRNSVILLSLSMIDCQGLIVQLYQTLMMTFILINFNSLQQFSGFKQ